MYTFKNARRIFAAAILGMCLLISTSERASAALVVTLTHDGSNGVVASFLGSGVYDGANVNGLPDPLVFVDDLGPGSPFNANLNFAFFSLATAIPFTTGHNIVQIVPDDDTFAGTDDLFFSLNVDLTTSVNYNVNGSSAVNGLAFSDLTPGTYTNPADDGAIELGGFTLIIQDVQNASEPGGLAVLGLGLAGIGLARWRKMSGKR